MLIAGAFFHAILLFFRRRGSQETHPTVWGARKDVTNRNGSIQADALEKMYSKVTLPSQSRDGIVQFDGRLLEILCTLFNQ
jgi:hypothetical protein